MINTNELVARLEKVEKQNRRMKMLGFCVLVVLASVLYHSCVQAGNKIVRATEFIVTASNGHDVAFINEDGLSIGCLQVDEHALYVSKHGDRSMLTHLEPGYLRLTNPGDGYGRGVSVENVKGGTGTRLNISGLFVREDGEEIYQAPDEK